MYEPDLAAAIAVIDAAGVRKPEAEKWVQILQHGVDFANAATSLLRANAARPARERPSFLIPYAVNSAFAIELMLKALGVKYGQQRPWGHDLGALYRKLPNAARVAIVVNVPSAAARRGLVPVPDVDKVLQEIGQVFDTWRYAFEKDPPPISPQEVQFICELLFDTCRSKLHSG